MNRPTFWLIVAIIPLLAGCSPQPEARTPQGTGLDAMFERDDLVVVSKDGSRHQFVVYLATSPDQQRRGLMFVRELPERTGMLFVYDGEATRSMWMKNTFIPLDMFFIRADGTVSSIAYHTEPQSLESVAALEPVRYVLELNAGMAKTLSIDKYSRVEWDGMPSDE